MQRIAQNEIVGSSNGFGRAGPTSSGYGASSDRTRVTGGGGYSNNDSRSGQYSRGGYGYNGVAAQSNDMFSPGGIEMKGMGY